jgi:general L-amino acid transport system substrate-binding protein
VAELHGITQDNVDQVMETATDAEVTNRLGKTGTLGADMGLDNEFAVRAIKAAGNYGEIYDRHVGPDTPMGLPRGINALWVDGGLQYAPPFK